MLKVCQSVAMFEEGKEVIAISIRGGKKRRTFCLVLYCICKAFCKTPLIALLFPLEFACTVIDQLVRTSDNPSIEAVKGG